MEREFDSIPIKKLVFKLGVPAMCAQGFNILYSIVDRIFVGNISSGGELALGGIGICAPALTLISAFAFLVGIGGSALMSMSIGRKNNDYAKKTINNAFLMLIVISFLITLFALIFRREILDLLGCSEILFPLAEKYFKIYICGTFAAVLGTGMNQFILAQGYAKQGMVSIIIGAVLNLLLDPIFIFVFDMGVGGAALATVIAQICSMIYVLRFLRKKEIPVRLSWGGFSLNIGIKIISIGIMSFIITVLDNFIIILLNLSLMKYGGEITGTQYVACVAVVQGFMSIVFCPAQGISTGCATLFGYHYGAGNYEKVMQVFKWVLLLCMIYICGMYIAAQFASAFFAGLFMKDAEYIALSAEFIRKYTLGLPGVAIQYAFVDGLTAMGKIKYALPLSFFRKAVYIACVIVLPGVTILKNIFYAGAVSDIIGASFTVIVFLCVVRLKLKRDIYMDNKLKKDLSKIEAV